MSDHFEITIPNKVPCFSQLLGKNGSISCFPTSVAMCLKHCLNILGKDKSAIGCGPNTYLEDYVNMLLEDKETIQWIKTNGVKYNSWWLSYLPKKNQRQIHAVEAYIFNRLMNPLGFKATATSLTYNSFCETLEQNNLPIIISGHFKSVSKVDGHINVATGFDKTGLSEIITNDPYGNALKGYPVTDNFDLMRAEYIRYPAKFFINKDNLIYGVIISKI
jgi:hypothetical protein